MCRAGVPEVTGGRARDAGVWEGRYVVAGRPACSERAVDCPSSCATRAAARARFGIHAPGEVSHMALHAATCLKFLRRPAGLSWSCVWLVAWEHEDERNLTQCRLVCHGRR